MIATLACAASWVQITSWDCLSSLITFVVIQGISPPHKTKICRRVKPWCFNKQIAPSALPNTRYTYRIQQDTQACCMNGVDDSQAESRAPIIERPFWHRFCCGEVSEGCWLACGESLCVWVSCPNDLWTLRQHRGLATPALDAPTMTRSHCAMAACDGSSWDRPLEICWEENICMFSQLVAICESRIPIVCRAQSEFLDDADIFLYSLLRRAYWLAVFEALTDQMTGR